ncbi:MAG: tetratricopeptide repeat protein, partial [Elusimicrobiales bacterium]|nr:tetratricopeptide repeat protein [Elusimicrobiales bacterium]
MKILKKLQIFVYHFLFLSNILSAAYQDPPKTVWEAIMKEQSRLNLSRGISHMSEEEYSKASIEFLKAIEKDPSSMAYTMYAASLYWMGDNEGALKNYEKALDLDPKND